MSRSLRAGRAGPKRPYDRVKDVQEVEMEDGKLETVLLMDVEIQSPNPVQIPLTPENVYIQILDKVIYREMNSTDEINLMQYLINLKNRNLTIG